MGRTKLVLAAVAVMVAMLVAFAAPAIADDGRNDHHRWNNWHDGDRFDHDDHLFISDFDDDCKWKFQEGWFFGFWGWQWGWWFLDC
jgi:hypothetical protein